jgi:sarcosine oxidase
VTTDRATYHAGTLNLARGPWLPALVDASLARHFSIHRQALFWFDVDGPIARSNAGAFLRSSGSCPAARSRFTAFPAIDGPQGGVKIATETYATTTTADTIERAITPEETAAIHADYIAPYFPRCRRAASAPRPACTR